MRFRLVPKSVTLNDLERRNCIILRYIIECGSFRDALRKKLLKITEFTDARMLPQTTLA